MADQDSVLESTASAEVQAKAQQLGWQPPERFKGDPARFVDAEEYLERGETVLPLVREHNKRLQTEVAQVRAQGAETRRLLESAQRALETLQEESAVATARAAADARDELVAKIAAASEAGDHETLAALVGKAMKLGADPAPAAKKEEPPAPATLPAELVEWQAENPWYGKDKRKTGLYLGIAQELREAGETSKGRAFYDKVTEELDAMLESKGEDPPPAASKVSSARQSGSRSGSRKDYASLPAEAKAACDSQTRDFVGKGKKYATAAEWQSRYAEIYFKD